MAFKVMPVPSSCSDPGQVAMPAPPDSPYSPDHHTSPSAKQVFSDFLLPLTHEEAGAVAVWGKSR